MSKVWENFSEYIINNYHDSKKIIEVGVGKITEPSDILKKHLPNTTINLVDIYPCNSDVIKDDITNPTDKIYEDADLIYSIRPPEELQPDILKLSDNYNSDVIIKPLFTEEINFNFQQRLKLVNYKRMAFYIMKRE
ncbi:UPF0146 family protein [uncultured Methanosphaera sp.]|uniref:UPF0146 family protein n=1 Tax=uncultured Methanosphaera sp. TaxID=262501 RepID=UPI002592515D|nr:UPF0146 family protein [uncultured Methanosphaera sp.]